MKTLITAILVSFFWLSFHFCLSERIRFDRLAMKAERDACYQGNYELRQEIAKMNKERSWIKWKSK
jgi:hypothetical protein